MANKKPMALGTLNTILNTAPLIIQGATRLVKMIRERDQKEPDRQDIPATLDGVRQEISRINERLDDNYESDVQQIRLIEELARQNELLATSMKKTARQIQIMSVVAVVSLLIGIVLLLKLAGLF